MAEVTAVGRDIASAVSRGPRADESSMSNAVVNNITGSAANRASGPDAIVRRTIRVCGVVQGVGFRPFAARLAGERHIGGSVRNARGQVIIEAYGTIEDIARYTCDLERLKPAGSFISNIIIEDNIVDGVTYIHNNLACDGTANGTQVAVFVPDVPRAEPGNITCTHEYLVGDETAFGTQVAVFVPDVPHAEPMNITCTHEYLVGDGVSDVPHAASACMTRACGFTIIESREAGDGPVMPAADLAVCGDCLRDLYAPGDPRCMNPFISCVHCGPRFSIMRGVPFDRENTSMDDFPLCPLCGEQYGDIFDRRFHAQTICCNKCGPTLRYRDRSGETAGQAALDAAIGELMRGGIIAIKGVGGCHLACSAYDSRAALALRAVKAREHKPFAVMLPDVASAREHCDMTAHEEVLLTEAARPIVLLRRRSSSGVAKAAYAASPYLGVFLPYTPLQHMVLRETGPLVMTSANVSSLPIIRDDAEMLRFFSSHTQLGGALWHDRRILRSLDDSVVMAVKNETVFIRRSRGYAPAPLLLPALSLPQPTPQSPSMQIPPPEPPSSHISLSSLPPQPNPAHQQMPPLRLLKPPTPFLPEPPPLLACGAQEKSCVCLYQGGYAYLSAEIGDLDTLETEALYRETVADMQNLLRIRPERVVCDLHPGYASTRYAEEQRIPLIRVQHHHAHIASVMAEHGLTEPVIGVAFDGTGYGADGTVWGGEFLMVSPEGYTRLGHLKTVTFLGSDESVRQGWKSAACMLYDAGVESPGDNRTALIRAALSRGVNTIGSSSMGRLFDAISSILNICDVSTYSGQCAIELENAAAEYLWGGGAQADALPFNIYKDKDDGQIIADFAPCVREIHALRAAGEDCGALAWRFHLTVCRMIIEVCTQLKNVLNICKVALGGGVFANRLLIENAEPMLRKAGFNVYRNLRVPAGDGGISLGQAYIGMFHKPV